MKNVNFDSLTNIKAPEHFIENALNIPATVEKKKPILLFSHSRAIAAVACLILVSVVSITIYLTQDRITPPIDPSYSQTDATDSTDNVADSSQPQGGSTTSNHGDTGNTYPTKPYEEIEPTEDSSGKNPTSDKTDPSTAPTEDNSKPDIVGPTQPPTVEPTEEPTESPTAKPTVKPTVKPTSPPTDPPPDATPPEEPTDEPTDAPWDPEDPWNPAIPTEAPTESPTENPFANIRFSCSIPTSFVADDTLVYCMVYDSNGYLIGDSNLYSSQHRAYILGYSNGKAILSYSLPDGLITKHGTYTYYFYNRYGDTLYRNSKYI